MKKGTRFLIELFIVLSFITCGVQATTQTDVTLTTDIVAQEGQTILSGNVMVEFHNLDLYNDQVKLSWHIYSADGELLVFENQRYPVSLQNGRATIPVNIDLAALALPQGEISIRFDLVDEENLYWFNDHPECVVDAAELRWQPTELSTPSSKVTITSNLPDVIYQKKLSGTVKVHFDNPVLYHDQVKLSWHLYAEDGTELLFENQRLPLTYEDGVATALVEIDLGTVEPVSSAKNFVLRFDLVDERDVFWFSQSDQIALDSVQVSYEHNLWKEMGAIFHHALYEQTVLFLINIVVFVGLIIALIIGAKKVGFKRCR